MNRRIKIFFIPAVIFFSMLASCLKQHESNSKQTEFVTVYGEVSVSGNYTAIVTDQGKRLNIYENKVSGFGFVDGMRVIANYTELASVDGNQINVTLNAVWRIHTKTPLSAGSLSESDRETLGEDPVFITSAWFSAGKYFNINFEMLSMDKALAHGVNLVIEDMGDDHIIFAFKHNAFDDPIRYRSYGRVSFILSDLQFKSDLVNVTLKWTNYNGEDKTASCFINPRNIQNIPINSVYLDSRSPDSNGYDNAPLR